MTDDQITTKEWIENFIQYALDQLNNIANLRVATYPSAERAFQKTLYLILIDMLSIAAQPALIKRNRARFLNLVKSATLWADRDRISLQQLILSLESRDIKVGDLYHFSSGKVQKWPEGTLLTCSKVDPLEKSIKVHISNQDEAMAARESRYDSLLYQYRNSLLHECREPGYGSEFRKESEPFYHSMINQSWQLVFPLEFFRRLCISAIWGLRNLLIAENRNPYDAYPFGSLWKPNLY